MKRLVPRGWAFPLAILAFTGVAVRYVNLVFTTNTRWVIVGVLTISLLAGGRLFAGLRTATGALALTYAAWCVLTTVWSEVPDLSAGKSVAQFFVVGAFMSGGILWTQWHGARGALSALLPVVALALFAGLAAGSDVNQSAGSGLASFEGLTGNSNMLGSLAAMSMPVLIWECYLAQQGARRRWFWWGLTTVVASILLWSVSRSAIAAVLLTGLGLLLGLGARRGILIGSVLVGGIGLVGMIAPQFTENAQRTFVVKYENEDVFFSRAEVWAESYRHALLGGVIGGGFGVTIGDTNFRGGLNAIGYGREQGNSQLAIWEQTGLVGLALYTVLVLCLLLSSWGNIKRASTREEMAVSGIVFGAVAGFLFMSVFEAWWVAPGSAESAFFWALVGLSEGLRKHFAAGRRRVAGAVGARIARAPAPAAVSAQH